MRHPKLKAPVHYSEIPCSLKIVWIGFLNLQKNIFFSINWNIFDTSQLFSTINFCWKIFFQLFCYKKEKRIMHILFGKFRWQYLSLLACKTRKEIKMQKRLTNKIYFNLLKYNKNGAWFCFSSFFSLDLVRSLFCSSAILLF